MSGGGVGGFGARLQALIQQGQSALGKIAQKGKEGADGKTEVKGEAKTGQAGGAQGAGAAKGKGKAKGADATGVGALLGGSDQFGVEDDDQRDRKRRQRLFLGDAGEGNGFVQQDGAQDRSSVSHINAEFRGQVASGMVQGRSFTQGSCLVPDTPPDQDDQLDAKKKRR